MNILHLFSGNLFTGAVEHALELGCWQQQQGHKVLLASDMPAAPNGLPYVTIPVHDRRYLQRFRNAAALRAQVAAHHIEVVHAHSRAASAIAHRALKGSTTALVSTVHGRQHVHFTSKHFDVYGAGIIAVSDDLRTHLIEELRKNPGKISVIPNGLLFPEIPKNTLPDFTQLAWIGRLSGPKGARAAALFESVFPQLLADFPDISLHIAGNSNGPIPNNGDAHLEALVEKFPQRVQVHGFLEDIVPLVQTCGLIIGAGRVAIRAIGFEKTVLALGEAGSEGIVSIANFEACAQSNFGDTGHLQENVTSRVQQELNAFLKDPRQQQEALHQRAPLRQKVLERYSLDRVGHAIMQVYKAALLKKTR